MNPFGGDSDVVFISSVFANKSFGSSSSKPSVDFSCVSLTFKHYYTILHPFCLVNIPNNVVNPNTPNSVGRVEEGSRVGLVLDSDLKILGFTKVGSENDQKLLPFDAACLRSPLSKWCKVLVLKCCKPMVSLHGVEIKPIANDIISFRIWWCRNLKVM